QLVGGLRGEHNRHQERERVLVLQGDVHGREEPVEDLGDGFSFLFLRHDFSSCRSYRVRARKAGPARKDQPEAAPPLAIQSGWRILPPSEPVLRFTRKVHDEGLSGLQCHLSRRVPFLSSGREGAPAIPDGGPGSRYRDAGAGPGTIGGSPRRPRAAKPHHLPVATSARPRARGGATASPGGLLLSGPLPS